MGRRPAAFFGLLLFFATLAATGCASNSDQCDPATAGSDCDGNARRTCAYHSCEDAMFGDCKPHYVIQAQSCGALTCTTERPGATECLPPGTQLACTAEPALLPAGKSAIAADLDGDGHADLVALDGDGGAQIFLARGAALSAPVTVSVPAASRVFAADFDGDGHLDLIFDATPSIVVAHGAGDGTFAAATPVLPRTRGLLLVADADGDHRADLFLGSLEGLAVFVNRKDGAFTPRVVDIGKNDPGTLVAGDFDADGKLDVAMVDPFSFTTSEATVYLGAGDGTFRAAATVPTGPQPRAAIADVDGDGHLDLVLTAYGDAHVSIALGAGDGTFRAPTRIASGAAWTSGARPADVNGDGKIDLVLELEHHAFGVLVGDGRGGFTPSFYDPTREDVTVLATLDTDGDGRSDAVIAGASGLRVVRSACQ